MFEKKELEYECDEILAPQVQLDIAEAAVPRPELTESACINH